MKKRDIVKRLPNAFPAPAPEGKRAFFQKVQPERMSLWEFMRSQAGYIRKSAWVVSALVLVLALAVAGFAPEDTLWTAGALVPFAALVAVTESGRSAFYAMEELELATRFSLKSVVLARMGVMGLAHALLLAAMTPLGGAGFFRTGVYLLTPYLLTALTGLAAARRLRGREGVYVCGAMAVLISGLNAALHSAYRGFYAPEHFPWWLGALALCAALTGRELTKTIKRTEELA